MYPFIFFTRVESIMLRGMERSSLNCIHFLSNEEFKGLYGFSLGAKSNCIILITSSFSLISSPSFSVCAARGTASTVRNSNPKYVAMCLADGITIAL